MKACVVGYMATGAFVVGLFLINNHARQRAGDAPMHADTLHRSHASWLDCLDEMLMALVGLIGVGLLWPFLVIRLIYEDRRTARPGPMSAFTVPDDFLICEVAVADIELWETVEDPLGAAPRVPFGHLNPAWTAFKAEAGTAGLWRFYGRAVGFLGVEWCYEGYVALKADGTRPYFMTRKGEVASA